MKKIEFNFLTISILVSFLFLGAVISPFLTTLVLAAILVTGTMPLYEKILKKVKGRKRLAALLMSLSIGIIFSFGFFVFIILLSQEAAQIYQNFETLVKEGKINVNDLVNTVSKYVGIPPVDVLSSFTQAVQSISSTLLTQGSELIRNVAWLLLNFFLLVFSMFFFFKDGKFFVETVENALPLPRPYGRQIFEKFRQVSLAMLYGVFLTAIIQGALGGVGFALAGINNPLFWATLMGFLGMLPIGGTGIIWLPAGLYLLMSGHYVSGIGLLLWGTFIVALVDNLIKPFLISKQTKIYPLATFLVVIGGLMVFGLKGAIIAPMVLAALVSLVHIYQTESTVESKNA